MSPSPLQVWVWHLQVRSMFCAHKRRTSHTIGKVAGTDGKDVDRFPRAQLEAAGQKVGPGFTVTF